ncbi:MAG: TolC family protein, partial [Fimbriimonadaceae bacterium]
MNAIAVALATLIPLSASSKAPMTIDEAVSIAESNAFSILIAQSNVERSRQVLRQAQALLGPQMTATTTYTRFDKELRVDFGPQSIVTRPIDSTTSQVQVGLPIDISRTIRQGIEAARNQLRAAEASLLAEQEQVRLDVRTAYYRVLQAEEQVRVGEEQVRLAKERLANAEAAVRAGAGARIDVLTFEAFLAQSEAELVAFRNQSALAKQFLNNILGRPIDTDFEAVAVEGLPAFPSSVDQLVETALTRRPDLKAVELSREALRFVRQGEERGLRPSLAVGVGYTYNWDPQGFGSERGTTAGTLTLSLPV